MAGKFFCHWCKKPETRARVVVDQWMVCGDCLFRQEYGDRGYSPREAVDEAFEAMALFDLSPYQ